MSDADLLLEAIWANPDDDTPRLVYADWLQENGYEDYARYIRLSIEIARGFFLPTVRSELRRQRHELGNAIVTANPKAFPLTNWQLNHSDYGIANVWHETEAADFLKNWPHWWPFIRPKALSLLAVTGREIELGQCEYLRRIVALVCEGDVEGSVFESSRERVRWFPVSGVLLQALADSPHLERLTALKVEPIRASADELLAFADSPLAARLTDLHLWVQFPDSSRTDLRGLDSYVREQIADFVAEHTARFYPARF